MKFLLLVAFLAIVSCVYMARIENPTEDKEKSMLTKYFHKKMCYCVKTKSGTCEQLKCCEVFKYVPYKIVVKMCKYGACQFITEEDEEEEIIGGGDEEHSGIGF